MSTSEIKSGLFTYSAAGFLYAGEARSSNAVIGKRLATPSKCTVKWLKAQLAHYAIKPLAGTKEELEARLREAHREGKMKGQPIQLKDLEKGLKAAHEARLGVAAAGTAVGKKGASGAGAAGEKKKPAAAPAPASASASASATAAGSAKIEKRRKKPAEPARPKVSTSASTASAKPSAAALDAPPKKERKPPESFAEKVLGTYSLTCADISAEWGIDPEDMYLQVFRNLRDPSGGLIAEFDLGLVHGVMRLDWIPASKRARVPFSWCGETGDERVIQYGDNRGEVEFLRDGNRVRGSFAVINGVGAAVGWEGVKTSSEPTKGEIQWQEYSREEYERRMDTRW